jgi:glycosyltransferase involved in cell wall biosynthesis
MNSLKIGIVGPITVRTYRQFIDQSVSVSSKQPEGLGGTNIDNLVLELLARGRNVTIFTLDGSIEDEVILQGKQLRICIGPYRNRHRAIDLFATERRYLVGALRRERPDIVHAHWTYEFALGALQSNLPTLVSAHDAPLKILRLYPNPYRAVRALMAFQVSRRASHMTAVSSHIASHYVHAMRHCRPIAVVPNCLPPQQYWRKGIESKEPDRALTYACVMQGFGRGKNGIIALRAFKSLRARIPSARLMMFGEDLGHGESAMNRAVREGLAENVSFIGRLPYWELQSKLAEMVDVLVHPSLEESFGMVLIEAMALSIPVIAGEDSGGTRYVLDEGNAGILADVRSPEALEAAMLRCANKEVRRYYGERGFTYVHECFRSDVVADAYEMIYESIADQERCSAKSGPGQNGALAEASSDSRP